MRKPAAHMRVFFEKSDFEAFDQEDSWSPSPFRGFHDCPGRGGALFFPAEKGVEKPGFLFRRSCLPSFFWKGHKGVPSAGKL